MFSESRYRVTIESPSPSERSSLLDISTLKPEVITPVWALCPGYLDTVLSIFQRHDHPFILVSTLAMRWSGGNNCPQNEIDVLVRSSHLQALVDGLVESGEWEVSKNYADIEGEMNYQSLINHTSIHDVWLKACFPDPAFEYLRFWPEELYHLSVDCNKVEVPDISIRNYVVLEE
jgi:hypothetical protein